MHFRLASNPFGNTFSLFCSPRVYSALLGNVYPTFRLPRVLLNTLGRHFSPFLLPKDHSASVRRLASHFWGSISNAVIGTMSSAYAPY